MCHPLIHQYPVTDEEYELLEKRREKFIREVIIKYGNKACSNKLAREGGRSMSEKRVAKVGDVVIWHNSVGLPHKALVTAVWSPNCINLVVVSSDEKKTDDYGRQIERNTSSSHGAEMKVHGFYWRFEDEEPNPYIPPLEK